MYDASKKTRQNLEAALVKRARELGVHIPPERRSDIVAGADQLADSADRVRAFLAAIDAQARKP